MAKRSEKIKAVELLAKGKPQQEVACELKVSLTTVQHWNCQPDFQQQVAEARERDISEWRAKFSSAEQRQWLWDQYKAIVSGPNKQAAVAALAMMVKLGGFDKQESTPVQTNVVIEFPLIHDEANEQGELPKPEVEKI